MNTDSVDRTGPRDGAPPLNIALCILAKNEEACLREILHRLPSPGPAAGYDSIWGLDGHSTDATVSLFEERGIEVIQQTEPYRTGAMRDAIDHIDCDAFIFFSPDGNEEAADIPKFRRLLEDGVDLAIASRVLPGGVYEEDVNVLRWRKWASSGFTLAANALFKQTGPYVTDTSNGLRAITKDAAKKLELEVENFTAEFQMTIQALKMGLRIEEFPTAEGHRIAGDTTAPSIATGLSFVRCLLREFTRPRVKVALVGNDEN